MPHIHTKPGEHDLSVTAFIVRFDTDEPRGLFVMHKKLKTLMPPGGHVELDETPWGALEHELREETGYSFAELDVLQPKTRLRTVSQIVIQPQPILVNTHYIPDKHFHNDLDYLLVARDDPSGELMDGESHDLRWLTASEVAALSTGLMLDNIREISDYIFTTLLTSSNFEYVPASGFRVDKITRG